MRKQVSWRGIKAQLDEETFVNSEFFYFRVYTLGIPFLKVESYMTVIHGDLCL